jgi:hypothetical protein
MKLKCHGFSWTWIFMVSRRLRSQPILGADFISKTKMVLELGRQMCILRLLHRLLSGSVRVIIIRHVR